MTNEELDVQTTLDRSNRPWLAEYDRFGLPHSAQTKSQTLYEALNETAGKFPEYKAIDFMGTKFTFSKMMEKIDECADAFEKLGLKKGDTITICLPNIPQSIFAFYAANKLGVKTCMVHPLSSPAEIGMFLRDSGSILLVTVDLLYPRLTEILRETVVRDVIVCKINDYFDPIKSSVFAINNRKKRKKIEYGDHVYSWMGHIRNGQSGAPYERMIEPEEVAVILYSGGTSSGTPKGIMLSSMNFNVLGTNLEAYITNVRPGDSMLTILPLFHGFGLGICVHSILKIGLTCILVPAFTTDMFISTIKSKKPRFIAGVPSMYLGLLANKKAATVDYSFLKGAFCGGDSVKVQLKERFNEFMKEHGGTVTLREGYGLTETVTAATIVPEGSDKLNSVGLPFPDLDVKVVALDSIDEVPVGTQGEICFRGGTIMLGYLNSPEETIKSLKTHADGQVWLHTGDMGYMDEQGYLYFCWRIKRIIKVSGYPVYPTKIEETVMEYPGVEKCCAIGYKDDFAGQRVKVFVVMQDKNSNPDTVKEGILKLCKEKLNKWSQPKDLELRMELPLTKVGKIDVVALEREENARRGQ